MRALLLGLSLLFPVAAHAQRERQIQAPDNAAYSRKFFLQLRGVFGRFRDADLQRAFDRAKPIQCLELVNEKGEWRTVAFFNEKRELGDWYRSSFDEVKADLTVFTFGGVCRGDRGPVQLTTKFPVTETVEAFNRGKIGLNDIEVNVNAPVRASFDAQTEAYTFDLPYLFLVDRQDDASLYSLAPPRLAERDRYATDVTDHWDCKSVSADAVTYQFLLCRTTTLPRNAAARGAGRPAFGASAFFILSDGREASSTVRLSFSDDTDRTIPADDARDDTALQDTDVKADWESPDSDERIMDIVRDDFRIRFNSATWKGRVSTPSVLSGKQLLSLDTATQPGAGVDYCVWLAGSVSLAGTLLQESSSDAAMYSVTAHDQEGLSPTSITIDISNPAGVKLGKLQCFFPRATSAVGINFSRFSAIVGSHLTLEVRP